MVSPVSNDLMGSGELINLMAEADKLSSEVRKDNKASRMIAQQKNLRLVDERISLLREQNEALSDSSWYQFAVGVVSNVLNIATQVVSIVIPPLAPVVQIANQAAQGAVNGAGQLDPYSKKGRALGVDAERAQKKATAESLRATSAEEHMKEAEESARTVETRLERAIANLQESGETVTRT